VNSPHRDYHPQQRKIAPDAFLRRAFFPTIFSSPRLTYLRKDVEVATTLPFKDVPCDTLHNGQFYHIRDQQVPDKEKAVRRPESA